MRTSDKTLLGSMGFADPDKRSSLHDWACQYLSQGTVGHGVISALIDWESSGWSDPPGSHSRCRTRVTSFQWHNPVTEWIIEGGYKLSRPVGFADVVIPFTEIVLREFEVNGEVQPSERGPEERKARALLEVKIKPVPTADIVRQLATYQHFLMTGSDWLSYSDFRYLFVAVTHFDLAREDVEMLSMKGFRHLRLGAAFDAYVAARQEGSKPSDSREI